MMETHRPVVSVVIAIVSDTTGPADTRHLVSCLQAFADQLEDPPVELIVPHLVDVEGIEAVKKRFPHVLFLPVTDLNQATMGSREHHDVLRARGLSAARGQFLVLVEDHAKPCENFCASVVAAHRENGAVIGGAIENAVDRPLNWAVYFCDFGKYQNPVPTGDSPFASDANVSYKRSALHSVRQTWEDSFREVVVNEALRSRGEHLVLDSDIIMYQNRGALTLLAAIQERFIWGRSYASTRNETMSTSSRMIYALGAALLPLVLTARIASTAWKRRRLFGPFLRSFHLVAILQMSWSLGEGLGYLTGVRR